MEWPGGVATNERRGHAIVVSVRQSISKAMLAAPVGNGRRPKPPARRSRFRSWLAAISRLCAYCHAREGEVERVLLTIGGSCLEYDGVATVAQQAYQRLLGVEECRCVPR